MVLGDLCEKPQYGYTASAVDASVGPRLLRITDLRNGALDWTSVPHCRCTKEDFQRYRLEKGDIVVARIGATTGKASIVLSPPDAVFASYLIRLRPKADVDPLFLYYFTQSRPYWTWVNANKDSNIKGGVNASNLTQLEVPVPTRDEQRKIASLLWKNQCAVELERRLITASEQLRCAILARLFGRGLLGESCRQTELGDLPASWRIASLEQVATIASGGTPSKGRAEYWNGPIPWASPKDLKVPRLRDTQDRISPAGLEAGSALAPAGSVLVVVRGMILVRDVPITLTQVPMAFNQDLKAVTPGEEIDPEYLFYAMVAYKSRLFQKIGRSAHGTRTLLSQELANFRIPIPSQEEQRGIALILGSIDRLLELRGRRQRVLQSLFSTTLDDLITGRRLVDGLRMDTPNLDMA